MSFMSGFYQVLYLSNTRADRCRNQIIKELEKLKEDHRAQREYILRNKNVFSALIKSESDNARSHQYPLGNIKRNKVFPENFDCSREGCTHTRRSCQIGAPFYLLTLVCESNRRLFFSLPGGIVPKFVRLICRYISQSRLEPVLVCSSLYILLITLPKEARQEFLQLHTTEALTLLRRTNNLKHFLAAIMDPVFIMLPEIIRLLSQAIYDFNTLHTVLGVLPNAERKRLLFIEKHQLWKYINTPMDLLSILNSLPETERVEFLELPAIKSKLFVFAEKSSAEQLTILLNSPELTTSIQFGKQLMYILNCLRFPTIQLMFLELPKIKSKLPVLLKELNIHELTNIVWVIPEKKRLSFVKEHHLAVKIQTTEELIDILRLLPETERFEFLELPEIKSQLPVLLKELNINKLILIVKAVSEEKRLSFVKEHPLWIHIHTPMDLVSILNSLPEAERFEFLTLLEVKRKLSTFWRKLKIDELILIIRAVSEEKRFEFLELELELPVEILERKVPGGSSELASHGIKLISKVSVRNIDIFKLIPEKERLSFARACYFWGSIRVPLDLLNVLNLLPEIDRIHFLIRNENESVLLEIVEDHKLFSEILNLLPIDDKNTFLQCSLVHTVKEKIAKLAEAKSKLAEAERLSEIKQNCESNFYDVQSVEYDRRKTNFIEQVGGGPWDSMRENNIDPLRARTGYSPKMFTDPCYSCALGGPPESCSYRY